MATAITYTGPFTAVTAPDGTVFTRGVSVPVADELAASLLLQNFTADQPSAPAPVVAPTALAGPAEAPAIQAPAPAVSVVPAAVPAAVLTPSTGV